MNKITHFTASAILGLGLLFGGAANAALYHYNGVVTLCTGTCASFASLDVGSFITTNIIGFDNYQALLDINTAPSGSFGDADMGPFTFFVYNPNGLLSGPVGDPINDNPLVFDSGLGTAASNGTSGSTDAANEINGGQILIELLVPPFSSNGAFMVFDLAAGSGKICLFYATAGCIPGATEAVRFEGSFSEVPIPAAAWLFGSALLGLGAIKRRKA